MNSRDEAEFHLRLAKGYLMRAESDQASGRWDSCLANAQEAVENAGKSILAHFRPTPKAHDVIELLDQLLKRGEGPEPVRQRLLTSLDAFRGMGLETHIRATYGDEESRTPPWELIQQPEAESGLEKARRAVAAAEGIFAELTNPPSVPDESSAA